MSSDARTTSGPALLTLTPRARVEDNTAPAIDVGALYRRYGPMVLRRCRRLLGDDSLAHDAMQDTFVQVLRHAGRLDARARSSLLYRIATNVCLNRIRSRGRHPEDAPATPIEEIARVTAEEPRSLARLTLARILGRELDASTAEMAVMHWIDEMTLEEVAREVGLSASGVRRRLSTLRLRLARTAEAVSSR